VLALTSAGQGGEVGSAVRRTLKEGGQMGRVVLERAFAGLEVQQRAAE
jgi:hypothetical protein